MKSMLHALIMAGGGGTRFWPRSREARPKQFLTFGGDRSLIQLALDRIEARIPPERTWVITSARHRDDVLAQLPRVPPGQVVGEPAPRDTAPCVALGAALIARADPQGVMAVTPSDHLIEPAQEFLRVIHAAAELAEEDPAALVTIGVPPTWASTGYGYVQRGAALPGRQGLKAFRVARFREKPDRAAAENYVRSGEYYWNAGVFVGRAQTFLDQFAAHEPEMLAGARRIADAWDTPDGVNFLRRDFPTLKKISFDFAVMEKCPQVLVVEATYQWDDVGSWLALERLHAQDAAGNTIVARHAGVETSRCIVVGDDQHVIATLGVKDLIIVQDGDCLLVADRTKESEVKKLVEELKRRGLEKHL
jgi:mannose-1-phosphate guanylyltransferase